MDYLTAVWGDFDLDGDQDVAIMGQSPTGVTAILKMRTVVL
jgi:hypothetical protein